MEKSAREQEGVRGRRISVPSGNDPGVRLAKTGSCRNALQALSAFLLRAAGTIIKGIFPGPAAGFRGWVFSEERRIVADISGRYSPESSFRHSDFPEKQLPGQKNSNVPIHHLPAINAEQPHGNRLSVICYLLIY
ncbi:MAG: hypothetical protein WAP34_09000 [Desulfomonilia bacterium]|jgi:hypothetical protein